MTLLDHAKSELEAAAQSLSRLQQSTHVDELDAHWKAFLRHLERTWFKAQAELKCFSKWEGWPERGRVEHLRAGEDGLLAYLRFARGAEEHGIDPIALKTKGDIAVNPVTPGGGLFIDEMKIDGNRISIKSRQPFRVQINPARYTLLQVVNRGRRYEVPTMHLDAPLAGSDPLTVARAGFAFYEKFLVEAADAFDKGK